MGRYTSLSVPLFFIFASLIFKMEFTDTHCHLFLPEFDKDRDEVIQRGLKSNVRKFFLPNVDSSTLDGLLSLSRNYPSCCFPLAGLHPSSVEEDYREELEKIKDEIDKGVFHGIGEIGLDFYWDRTFAVEQEEALTIQLSWARDMNLPAIIHVRNSFDETIRLIKKVGGGNLRGIFHCFTGTEEQAKQVIDIGFHLGIGGILTFKNAGLDQVLRNVSLEHLVLETDSPYLAPVPKRGKRNEPAFLPYVANKLAEIKEIDVHQIARQTNQNARLIFGI